MAYCTQCGNELAEEAQFCANCGAAVGLTEAAAKSPSESEEAQETDNGNAQLTGRGISKDIRNWAMLCHLASFAGFAGIPIGNILGPLLVWLLKREESPFIDAHGKEALNFQISVTIYAIVCAILILILIGILLLVVLILFALISVIKAAIRANNGAEYRYPLTIRFIN